MSRDLVALTDAHERWQWATPRYLRRLVAERRIPHHKIAGRIWLDAADLDGHQEQSRREPARSRRLRPAS